MKTTRRRFLQLASLGAACRPLRGGIIRVPMIIMVHPSLPANSVPEPIAYAKANPGNITMASAGNGSAPQASRESRN